jgi:hypothetical protein
MIVPVPPVPYSYQVSNPTLNILMEGFSVIPTNYAIVII